VTASQIDEAIAEVKHWATEYLSIKTIGLPG